jgi:hypothetical protein
MHIAEPLHFGNRQPTCDQRLFRQRYFFGGNPFKGGSELAFDFIDSFAVVKLGNQIHEHLLPVLPVVDLLAHFDTSFILYR